MNRILITAPVRQKKEILFRYLESLDNLKIPENTTVDRYFILHNCYDEIHRYFSPLDVLDKFEDDSNDVRNLVNNAHNWQPDNFKAIVKMKNRIKNYALKNDYDYMLMVDSDMVLHEQTLNHLYNILEGSGENVIGEVFYTDWDKSGKMLPNAWDLDNYSFFSDPETRYKVENVSVYQVGGTGACVLSRVKIFKNESVNYNPIPNISFTSWEDRAFCTRCYVNGFKIFLDTTYPCKHLYRD